MCVEARAGPALNGWCCLKAPDFCPVSVCFVLLHVRHRLHVNSEYKTHVAERKNWTKRPPTWIGPQGVTFTAATLNDLEAGDALDLLLGYGDDAQLFLMKVPPGAETPTPTALGGVRLTLKKGERRATGLLVQSYQLRRAKKALVVFQWLREET